MAGAGRSGIQTPYCRALRGARTPLLRLRASLGRRCYRSAGHATRARTEHIRRIERADRENAVRRVSDVTAATQMPFICQSDSYSYLVARDSGPAGESLATGVLHVHVRRLPALTKSF